MSDALYPAPGAISTDPVAPPHPLDASWHVQIDGQTHGPLTGHDVVQMIRGGRLTRDVHTWRVGSADWETAETDAVLSRHLPARAPAPSLPSVPAAPPFVQAAERATVVQVTNTFAAPAAQSPTIVLEDGPSGDKSAGVALLLSFLICGAGQMYNGQVAKGLLMLIGSVLLWFILLGWIINIWSWIDAYKTAKAMNRRYQRRLLAGMM